MRNLSKRALRNLSKWFYSNDWELSWRMMTTSPENKLRRPADQEGGYIATNKASLVVSIRGIGLPGFA